MVSSSRGKMQPVAGSVQLHQPQPFKAILVGFGSDHFKRKKKKMAREHYGVREEPTYFRQRAPLWALGWSSLSLEVAG